MSDELTHLRTVAMLAQALIDSEDWEGCDPSTFDQNIVADLRKALTRIPKGASSVDGRSQKDSREDGQPPEAGEN